MDYLAPERVSVINDLPRNKYSYPSDIWSLGIILYEILFKSYPYKNMTAQDYTDFVFTNHLFFVLPIPLVDKTM